MNPEQLGRLEAWLQYFADLGFAETFRSRAISDPPVPACESGAAASTPVAKTAPASSVNTAQPWNPEAPSRMTTAALPVLQNPSLFDTADRVENDSLEKIRETIGDCTRCRLHERRTHIVFGCGNPEAELVFVGEGPGRDEDIQGVPFVGRAGKLLTQMIEAMGLRRDDVYICNVVKCRPPENRTPEKDEMATCSPFLLRQLGVIQPKAIVCLGAVAAHALLGANISVSRARGQWFDFQGAQLMPTYHPAYLLRNPAAKGTVWKDLQQVIAFLGLEPGSRNRAPRPGA